MSRWRRPAAVGLGGKVLELASLVPLLTVVPRALGPDDYGAFALALALVTIGSTAAALGGPTVMSRYVPAAPAVERAGLALALLVRSTRWRLGFVGLAAIAVVVAAARGAWTPLPAALVASALALDVAATLLYQSALALGRVAAWSLRYPLQNAVLVASVVPLHEAWGRDGALVSLPLASGAALLGASVLVLPQLRGVTAARSLPPGLVRFAVLQSAANALLLVTQRGGIVAVALLGGSAAEQGFAGVAIGLALAGTFAVGQLFAVELPRLSAAAAADPAAAERALHRLARPLAIAVTAAAALGALLAEPLLGAVAGRSFREAGDALGIALAVVVLAPAASAASQIAALRLRPDLRLAAMAAGASAWLVAAVALVPPHAAAAAAAALVVGTAASVAVLGLLLRPALAGLLWVGSLVASGAVVILAVTR